MDEDAYGRYYREIELHWSLLRGNQVIVSPLEFAAMESWHEAGIPQTVVLRAIERFLERKKKLKRQRAYLLSHVQGDVEKLWQEYQQLRVGEADEGGPLIEKKVAGLLRGLNRLVASQPDHSGFLKGIVAQIKAMDLRDYVTFDAIESELERIDCELTRYFLQGLDAAVLEGFHAEVSEFIGRDEDADLYDRMLLDVIRLQFGIPRLTIMT